MGRTRERSGSPPLTQHGSLEPLDEGRERPRFSPFRLEQERGLDEDRLPLPEPRESLALGPGGGDVGGVHRPELEAEPGAGRRGHGAPPGDIVAAELDDRAVRGPLRPRPEPRQALGDRRAATVPALLAPTPGPRA